MTDEVRPVIRGGRLQRRYIGGLKVEEAGTRTVSHPWDIYKRSLSRPLNICYRRRSPVVVESWCPSPSLAVRNGESELRHVHGPESNPGRSVEVYSFRPQ